MFYLQSATSHHKHVLEKSLQKEKKKEKKGVVLCHSFLLCDNSIMGEQGGGQVYIHEKVQWMFRSAFHGRVHLQSV